ncbi:hypothetical protein CTI12_AA291190 [Artemisia annua]|uniref:Uncharacterized protein n=1 Tax=Artemisia annua TaxID=35608 RepID=A0A2U1N9U6_ARTAN|nr:hypothetical protein CTI12_AA291190 [Artemisia annua]
MNNHTMNGHVSITARLARLANSDDRGRQFFLFFERFRFIYLTDQRDDRRRITRERAFLQQLQSFVRELEGVQDSVLISRTLALLRALVAVQEQRIRAYGRSVIDAGRVAGLLMDYLGDVMHL